MIRIASLNPARLFLSLVVLAVAASVSATNTLAQDMVSQDANDQDAANQVGAQADENLLPVGLAGVYRAGQWTMVTRPDGVSQKASVQTLDGDGVNVVYEQPVPAEATALYAVPGLAAAPLVIRDADGKEVYRGRFRGRSIEPKMPWIVVFGDALGIETIGQNELLGREASVAVSTIGQGIAFPDQVIGLSGIDLIVVGPSSMDALSALSPEQGAVIVDWIKRGGRMLISLGSEAEAIFAAAPWLGEVVPVDKNLTTIRLDPSSIETYTSSQIRLPVLDAVQLPARGGETIISGRNAARQPARVAVEWTVGFGRVTGTAFALDSPELAAWPQRTLLVTRLCGTLFKAETDSRREARPSASVGFDDLAGQIRVSLDRFDSKPRIPYSVISLILIGLVAVIGPLDYLLVNRLFGKPLLGWMTFPISVLVVSAILVTIGRPAISKTAASEDSVASPSDSETPATIATQINRMEIVDVDMTSSPAFGRGWSWTHLYSLDATITPYPAQLSELLLASGSPQAITSAPFGHPGSTFGGISIAGEDTRMPAYQVAMSLEPARGFVSQIANIPLAPGGSKGIGTRWTFSPKLEGVSDLARRRGSELLEGRLTNSLPVDLINGALVYGEWVYLLPTRFRSGQTIDNVDTLRQKNFRWLLARREALENSSRSEPWNAEMYEDMPRLAEILMFNSVAGGRDYTGLSNRPLQDLDLSYLLSQDRAIMFGQLERPALEIDLAVQRASASAARVVLPVSLPRLTRSSE